MEKFNYNNINVVSLKNAFLNNIISKNDESQNIVEILEVANSFFDSLKLEGITYKTELIIMTTQVAYYNGTDLFCNNTFDLYGYSENASPKEIGIELALYVNELIINYKLLSLYDLSKLSDGTYRLRYARITKLQRI